MWPGRCRREEEGGEWPIVFVVVSKTKRVQKTEMQPRRGGKKATEICNARERGGEKAICGLLGKKKLRG